MIGLNKKHIQKEELLHEWFYQKYGSRALFNQDKINDLLRKELQQAVNDLLEAELTAFLGYNPYARCKRRLEYRQFGVTTREIADLIEKMYGSHYSPAQVSNISKQMIPKVEAYHKRKLSDKFFCVYLDATYVPLRRETFEREAVYIAIGIKPNGHKEVIDYCIAPNENIEVWTELLQSMKSHGLEQVELFLSDGVVGMKQALVEAYPKAHFQRCLVHVMRNICAKVRVDDREAVMNDFYAKWGKLYSHVVRNLKAIEADMLVFYNYPKQIRPSIYSTNMIESFNNIVKRKAKPKAKFPTEQSLNTFIGIQALSYNDRYFNRIHKGFGQVQDTLESYFD